MPRPQPTQGQSPGRPRRRGLLLTLAGIPVLAAGMFMAPATASAFEAGAGRGARMCAKLQCTDDQKKELRAIFAKMREDAKGDREAIKRLRSQMKSEFAKSQPDQAELRRLQQQISTHHQQLAARRLDAMLEVHGVLDADQRKRFMDLMEQRKRKHDQRRKARRDKSDDK